MTPVILRPAATGDLEDAYAWYEAQRPGLGQEFRESVDSALLLIAEAPNTYATVHRDTRRALLRKFPYGLFYRLVDANVVVVACMHAKRHPRAWRSRR